MRVALTLLLMTAVASAQYTQPTLFAVRVGLNTSSANVGGANVITGVNVVPFQDQSGWVSGAPFALSPTGSTALTISSTATSEGALSLTGNFLGFAGYRTGTNGSGTDRVIARIDISTATFTTASTPDTSTAIPNSEGYTANNIRGAVWNSAGDQYWAGGTGGGGGTRTNGFGTTSSSIQVSTSTTNTRVPQIFGGQLYTSSAAGTFLGVSTVGSGLPVTSGNTTTLLINAGSGSSSYGYAFSPDLLTAYVADDRASAAGGIQKWTRPDLLSPFTLATTFGTGVSNIGARGLAVDFTGVNPVIYASTAEGSNNRLITFSDVSGIQTGLTTIASSGTNDIFRGVAFTPIPEPMLLGLLGLGLIAFRKKIAI